MNSENVSVTKTESPKSSRLSEESFLKQLQRNYFSCVHPAEIAKLFNWIKEEQIKAGIQKKLALEVFKHPIMKKYPPHKDYSLSVIKHLVACLDQRGLVVEDCLYEYLGELLSRGQEENYVTFILPKPETTITLKEERAFVSKGTTGLKTWPASKILADYLIQSNIDSKKILELGAGVGLTGLSLLKMNDKIMEYTFTDCHSDVLQMLQHNISINGDDPRAKVRLLDWCVGGDVVADLVVGSDIIFDTAIIGPLISFLSGVCSRNHCEVIIASVIRDRETYKMFEEKAREAFKCEVIQMASFDCFGEPQETSYEILRMSKLADSDIHNGISSDGDRPSSKCGS